MHLLTGRCTAATPPCEMCIWRIEGNPSNTETPIQQSLSVLLEVGVLDAWILHSHSEKAA